MSVYLNPSITLNRTAIQHKIALSFAFHEYQNSFMVTLYTSRALVDLTQDLTETLFGSITWSIFNPDSLLFGYILMV
jgi:hypothetical protein